MKCGFCGEEKKAGEVFYSGASGLQCPKCKHIYDYCKFKNSPKKPSGSMPKATGVTAQIIRDMPIETPEGSVEIRRIVRTEQAPDYCCEKYAGFAWGLCNGKVLSTGEHIYRIWKRDADNSVEYRLRYCPFCGKELG